jgi:rare lipoprotein A
MFPSRFGMLDDIPYNAMQMKLQWNLIAGVAFAGALAVAPRAGAQSVFCEDEIKLDDAAMACFQYGPDNPPPPNVAVNPEAPPDPLKLRMVKYASVALKHRLTGLASYYSTSLNGTLTANGERYYNKQMSAAHLTLPLGSWVEIRSRATGRRIRLRVNDRGPYVNKFVIDLSQAAARALGVDMAEDRTVDIRIIALPGELPLPDEVLEASATAPAEEASK